MVKETEENIKRILNVIDEIRHEKYSYNNLFTICGKKIAEFNENAIRNAIKIIKKSGYEVEERAQGYRIKVKAGGVEIYSLFTNKTSLSDFIIEICDKHNIEYLENNARVIYNQAKTEAIRLKTNVILHGITKKNIKEIKEFGVKFKLNM
jgi:biotin operon repressor